MNAIIFLISLAWKVSGGAGKSNVIKQLSIEPDFRKSYSLFTYDAWGHQEDLQRRSILEVLTTALIKTRFLEGNGKVRLRNGVEKEDNWNSLLGYLLSNKTVTTTRPSVKVKSFAVCVLLLLCVANLTANVCSDRLADDCCYTYWILQLIPYVLGAVLIAVFYCKCRSFRFLYQWIAKEDEKVTEEYVSSEEPSIQEFRNWMSAISDYIGSKKKQKLIIVFDNMDRLAPEKVRQLWSSIYAFFAGEVFENIWVVIPYDEKHLVASFSGENEMCSDNFIKKTFSMVYRVSPPVISDYELLFNSYFEEAFGEHDDENTISQTFRVLNSTPNPRDVIYFLNQMVSLVRIWGEKVPLTDIALYVNRLLSHHRGNRSLDEYLLSDDAFEGVEALFVHKEQSRVNFTKLAYGLQDEKLAQQIPMRNYLRMCFESERNGNINDYNRNPYFIPVLKSVINVMPSPLVEKYIVGLGKLDESVFSENDRNEIMQKWDFLANIWKETDISKQEFGEVPQLLLSHGSVKHKSGLAFTIVDKLQQYSDFSGCDYFRAMDDLCVFLEKNSIDFDFSSINRIVKPAEKFWDYLNLARDRYLDYGISTKSKELMSYLSDSSMATCKWPDLVEYLADDYNYDFSPLLESCRALICDAVLNKSNICTLLYFESFVCYKIQKLYVLTKDVPNENDLKGLLPEMLGKDECKERPGYWNLVFLSIMLDNGIRDVEDEDYEELAKVSVMYELFGKLFEKLGNSPGAKEKLAARVIQLKLKGCLDLIPTINSLAEIQSATDLSWDEVLEYFSLYVDELQKTDKESLVERFESLVPNSLFPSIVLSNTALAKLLVKFGRKSLERKKTKMIDTEGEVVHSYWNVFTSSFLGSESWPHTDGFVLEELRKVFELYCKSNNFDLIQNDFVCLLIKFARQDDFLPIVNRVRNGFTVGNRSATVEEFKYFVSYFPKLPSDIPNKDTFVQNFIESAFVEDENCRQLILRHAKFYMPLINECPQIAKEIIEYIYIHMENEKACGKLYAFLSDEIKSALKVKEEEA